MIVAFWPSYFSRLADQPSLHHHAHGLAMTLWLVPARRAGGADARGQTGRCTAAWGCVSYLLVPVIVVVTLRFVHFTLQAGRRSLAPTACSSWRWLSMTLVTFVDAVRAGDDLSQAQPAVHARFMVSTLFPLFPPVTDRLIGRFMPSIIDLMPRIGGGAILQCAGFAHRRRHPGRAG